MRQITDAAIPAAEFQAYHRIDQHGTPLGVLCVDLITDIKRQERIQTTDFLTSSLSETQKQSYLIFNKIQYLKGDLG